MIRTLKNVKGYNSFKEAHVFVHDVLFRAFWNGACDDNCGPRIYLSVTTAESSVSHFDFLPAGRTYRSGVIVDNKAIAITLTKNNRLVIGKPESL